MVQKHLGLIELDNRYRIPIPVTVTVTVLIAIADVQESNICPLRKV